MKRRAALAAGVAVAGMGAIGGALWRSSTDRSRPRTTGGLWGMRFDTPQGGHLALGTLRGRPLLLNFWATWCAPCISELPLLDRFQIEQRAIGWQVVGLAIDNLAPVVEFLVQRPVSYPIALAGASGVELSRNLGNLGGTLPFTVVFNRSGEPFQHKLGVLQPVDLRRWVDSIA